MAAPGSYLAKEDKGVSRRDFLRKGLWASLAILAIESLVATIVSLWPKAQTSATSNRIVIGRASDFPVGSVTRFPDGAFFLSHVDSGFLALSQVCTHLGCVVPWKSDEKSEDKLVTQGRFNCPCHGGIYDRYGAVKAGPPPRPLDIHPITLDGDRLVVETGVIIRRQTYNESQVLKV